MLITSDQLKDIVRSELDDLPKADGDTSACLWSDADIYRYMNRAADRVARLVRSLHKTFRLDVTAGEPMVRTPLEKILDVRRAYLETARRDLTPLNLNADGFTVSDYGVTLRSSRWETTNGTPTSFVMDYTPGYLRLAPIPTADDVLVLQTIILPAEISAGAPVPFTDVEDIELVQLWIRKQAYEKQDADTFDQGKVMRYTQEFYDRVRDREVQHRRQIQTPHVVQSSW